MDEIVCRSQRCYWNQEEKCTREMIEIEELPWGGTEQLPVCMCLYIPKIGGKNEPTIHKV